MKKYRVVLALDPSGNFAEGKGTTGMCIIDNNTNKIMCTQLTAKDYDDWFKYYQAHIIMIQGAIKKYGFDNVVLVLEDYLLYADKAQSQTNSRFETPKLIGVIEYMCHEFGVPVVRQAAAQVKTRWANHVLEHEGIIQKASRGYKVNGKAVSRHQLDAVRHAVHYNTFKNSKEA